MSDDLTTSRVNPLPFQYQLRNAMLDDLDAEQRHVASEQRDRELEDYLGQLTGTTAMLAEGLAGATNVVAVEEADWPPDDPQPETLYLNMGTSSNLVPVVPVADADWPPADPEPDTLYLRLAP